MMTNTAKILKPYRDQIDVLDNQIVDLLVKRYNVVRDVAVVKQQHNIPSAIEERLKEVIDRVADRAGEDNEDMLCEIYALILAVACDLEDEIITGEIKFE